MTPVPREPAVSNAQTECPFCRSPRIITVGAKIDASSYWRCEACGEVWNLARLGLSRDRFSYRPGWR